MDTRHVFGDQFRHPGTVDHGNAEIEGKATLEPQEVLHRHGTIEMELMGRGRREVVDLGDIAGSQMDDAEDQQRNQEQGSGEKTDDLCDGPHP
jgi:hypothetical protein